MNEARKKTVVQWESCTFVPAGRSEIASYTHNGNTYDLEITRDADADADWLVCFDDLSAAEVKTKVPRERRLLLISEPVEIAHRYRQYCSAFRRQFGAVVTPHSFRRTHPEQKVVIHFPIVGSHYGIDKSADVNDASIVAATKRCMVEPDIDSKVSTVSIVNSGRTYIPGHTFRNEYAAVLKQRLGKDLESFGTTFRQVACKLEAIAPYRYHVVFENCFDENMWSEKLADAFLGLALPLYIGCPNVDQWFDKDAVIRLPGDDPNKAADIIVEAVRNGEFERRLPLLREARRKVLEDYSPYVRIAKVFEDLSSDGATHATPRFEQPVRMRSNPHCKSIFDIVAHKTRRVQFRIAMLVRREPMRW